MSGLLSSSSGAQAINGHITELPPTNSRVARSQGPPQGPPGGPPQPRPGGPAGAPGALRRRPPPPGPPRGPEIPPGAGPNKRVFWVIFVTFRCLFIAGASKSGPPGPPKTGISGPPGAPPGGFPKTGFRGPAPFWPPGAPRSPPGAPPGPPRGSPCRAPGSWDLAAFSFLASPRPRPNCFRTWPDVFRPAPDS